MARGLPRIKQEPGRRSMLSPAESTDMVNGGPVPRGARSDAPSYETRPAAQSALGNEMGDDDEDCVFMEMKPARPLPIKQQPDLMGSQSLQSSFIGPNRALKDFGQKLKAINDALGELQARGIQHVADLPELVLVGDQSSGKSSLMSAIAGLTLPRSSGTCTRCPIHIRVSRADEWSCRVYLKIDYQYEQPVRPLRPQDVTAKNKFPPWSPLDQHRVARHEFKTVRDRFDSEEIEAVLRCAQVAILNPSTPFQHFVPKLKGEAPLDTRSRDLQRIQEAELNAEAQFSPNTVALEVKGPDLADLNFYDLPGVFMSAKRDEDTFLERVVSNLTREYIARQNAIILWAVPMNQDAENSYAFNLIRSMRAVDRCVGIITKADLLPAGSSQTWLSMLDGETHHTGLGYFVTSRQGDDLEEQNTKEEAFFNRTADTTGYWPEEFNRFADHCGIEKLKSFLSLKLGEQFSKVLPEVKEKVNDRISAIEHQLRLYPDAPPNPEMEIMRSLAVFSRDVRDRVRQQDFFSTWDFQFMEKFKRDIIAMKPKYNVKDSTRAPPQPLYIDLDGDSSPAQRKRPAPPGHDLPSPSPKRPRPVNGNVKQEDVGRPIFLPASPSVTGSTAGRRTGSNTLLDIRQLVRRNATPGQPGLVSAEVYQPMFTEAARGWSSCVDVFIDKTINFLQSEIMGILEVSFGRLTNTNVYKQSKEHMLNFVEELRSQLRTQLHQLHSLESCRLFTKDEETLERNKAAEKRILVRHRHHYRFQAFTGNDFPNPPPKMEEMTEEQLAQEATRMQREAARMLPDPFEQELSVAAYVRGYYLTAANRFVDYAAMHVMSGLFPQVATKIDSYLHEKLGLMSGGATREMLENLMSEGPETANRRRELRAERETLEGAMSIITHLEADNVNATAQIQGGGTNGIGVFARSEAGSTERSPTAPLAGFGDA